VQTKRSLGVGIVEEKADRRQQQIQQQKQDSPKLLKIRKL
jgi:hypothetical protein